jgi:hypothetical protein
MNYEYKIQKYNWKYLNTNDDKKKQIYLDKLNYYENNMSGGRKFKPGDIVYKVGTRNPLRISQIVQVTPLKIKYKVRFLDYNYDPIPGINISNMEEGDLRSHPTNHPQARGIPRDPVGRQDFIPFAAASVETGNQQNIQCGRNIQFDDINLPILWNTSQHYTTHTQPQRTYNECFIDNYIVKSEPSMSRGTPVVILSIIGSALMGGDNHITIYKNTFNEKCQFHLTLNNHNCNQSPNNKCHTFYILNINAIHEFIRENDIINASNDDNYVLVKQNLHALCKIDNVQARDLCQNTDSVRHNLALVLILIFFMKIIILRDTLLEISRDYINIKARSVVGDLTSLIESNEYQAYTPGWSQPRYNNEIRNIQQSVGRIDQEFNSENIGNAYLEVYNGMRIYAQLATALRNDALVLPPNIQIGISEQEINNGSSFSAGVIGKIGGLLEKTRNVRDDVISKMFQ